MTVRFPRSVHRPLAAKTLVTRGSAPEFDKSTETPAYASARQDNAARGRRVVVVFASVGRRSSRALERQEVLSPVKTLIVVLLSIERLRSRLSTLAYRRRHATYGYAPLGSPHPVREEELARLQGHDADVITDAAAIAELAESIRDRARDGAATDLRPLEAALDRLRAAAGRRKVAS